MKGSTKHSLISLNTQKAERLAAFVEDYCQVCLKAIDIIWDNLGEDLKIPKFLDYKTFKIDTKLNRRIYQCAINQAGGIVRSSIEKQRRVVWVRKNKEVAVKDKKFSKPVVNKLFPQLSSGCVDIAEDPEGMFAGFVRISNIGPAYGHIKIPINKSSQFFKWKDRGAELCHAVKLLNKKFQLSWDWKRDPAPQGNKVLGVDQGFKTVCSLSDGQTTPTQDSHGHSLESILNKLSRRKKGSKSFREAQTHRKNFVHWSVNQLNFKDVKEVRLEKIVNIRLGKSSSRLMSHWSNPEIRDKIKRRCEELEVPVVEQSCAYRSQRCSCCGLVKKSNRKGKEYNCCGCGFKSDADLNAAKNHSQDLFAIPFGFRVQEPNKKEGFLWKSDGLFTLDGKEPIVPCSQKETHYPIL